MIEGSWDRRPALTRLHATPPWFSVGTVAGGLDERPTSARSSLSELQFVSEEEDATDPQDPGSSPSSCSQISQLHFAPPEETTTPTSSIEFVPLSRHSSLSFSTDSSSPGAEEGQARTTPSEQFSLTTDTSSVSPQRPGWAVTRLDGPTIPDSGKVGRRPLPEVPGHARSSPLPYRPEEMAMIPGWRSRDQFDSYPRRQEFFRGCSKDLSTTSQPASGPGPAIRSQSVEEKRPKVDPTSEDTPLTISPPAASPPLSLMIPFSPTAPIHSFVNLLPPTSIDLVTAAATTITGENGGQILFGALFRDRKVVVILIRHFWCLCCQDYVRSILNSVNPEILGKRGVDLVLIGNGTPGAIKAYKKLLKIPFKVYTDPSRQLHDALRLLKISDVQPRGSSEGGGRKSHVKHGGRWISLRIAVRAAAARASHDNCEQLGGEFVLGPGLKSLFMHKMQEPRDHAPIVEVLSAAGVEVCEKVKARGLEARCLTPTTPMSEVMDIDITTNASTPQLSPTPLSITTTFTSETAFTAEVFTPSGGGDTGLGSEPPVPIIADEAEWMVHRNQYLMRIKQKREARRRGEVLKT